MISADFNDLTIHSANEEQQDKIIRIIRYARPDVIITHSPNDYCSDHVELSKLVFNASFSASCPHFKSHLGAATPVTPLYYTDTSDCMDFIPTEYVDITTQMEIKEQMLKCHESQLKWLYVHDGVDIVGNMRSHAKQRGEQCQVLYAEAFRPLQVSGRMRTYRVLP